MYGQLLSLKPVLTNHKERIKHEALESYIRHSLSFQPLDQKLCLEHMVLSKKTNRQLNSTNIFKTIYYEMYAFST